MRCVRYQRGRTDIKEERTEMGWELELALSAVVDACS